MRERVDDFIRRHHGAGIVWEIDGERGVHLFLRVIRGRVFDHRDLVAQLSRIPHRGLHTRVGDESHDDEPMDAVFLELQIQIRVGEPTGPPMLEGHDVARVRRELAADLAPPRAVCEALSQPRCLLTGARYFQVS
jgi:hypothetical protein